MRGAGARYLFDIINIYVTREDTRVAFLRRAVRITGIPGLGSK